MTWDGDTGLSTGAHRRISLSANYNARKVCPVIGHRNGKFVIAELTLLKILCTYEDVRCTGFCRGLKTSRSFCKSPMRIAKMTVVSTCNSRIRSSTSNKVWKRNGRKNVCDFVQHQCVMQPTGTHKVGKASFLANLASCRTILLSSGQEST